MKKTAQAKSLSICRKTGPWSSPEPERNMPPRHAAPTRVTSTTHHHHAVEVFFVSALSAVIAPPQSVTAWCCPFISNSKSDRGFRHGLQTLGFRSGRCSYCHGSWALSHDHGLKTLKMLSELPPFCAPRVSSSCRTAEMFNILGL